jgi:hypothetical protein
MAGFARRLWWAIVFLVVVGAWAATGYTYLLLRRERAERVELGRAVAAIDPRFERFKEAVRDVDRRLSASVFQEVDLAAAGWQPIAGGGGFYVIDLATSPQGASGLKITGKVVNPTSVTHDAAQVSARIGKSRATFSLAHVPPAVAQPFEVVVPDVPAAAPRRAYFALDSSTINFASSTTRRRTGAEPVDTDKLLK